ncbi:MAG: hypothetical protein N3A38_06160 [Planctomycetota bacterium]|nr:hypothetical protein [Planctomycetota bacterium]
MRGTVSFVSALLVAIQVARGASAGEYALLQTIGQGELNNLVCVACDKDDRVVALRKDGTIKIFDKKGKMVQSIPAVPDPKTECGLVVVCDSKGNIYVVSEKGEYKEVAMGGRKTTRFVPSGGVVCRTLDDTGKQLKEVALQGAGSITSGAFAQGKLLLADRQAGTVLVYDPNTGSKVGSIGKNFRLYCGIFGFAVDSARNDILVANLGAFSVDRYGLDGKQKNRFGKRGEDPSSFHGCCNPVNLVVLPDGRLLTAEKDSTRIKIYDAEGKKCEQVLGDVTKLVEGCAYMPMAVDKSGNVYLASLVNDCIVKCGPKK